MEFRLTYEGELLSTRSTIEPAPCKHCGAIPPPSPDTRATIKHKIRKRFRTQLENYWNTHPQLKSYLTESSWVGRTTPEVDVIADEYQIPPFRWVPLIRENMMMNCDIRILYLRNGARGHVISDADIDNRVKTLIDAMRRPTKTSELPSGAAPDLPDEKYFFVLLENDNLITNLSVETDTLLDPTNKSLGDLDSRVVVTVKAWPYHVNEHNMGFT